MIIIVKNVFHMQNAWEAMSHLLKKAIGERAIRVQRSSYVHIKTLACNIFYSYHLEGA